MADKKVLKYEYNPSLSGMPDKCLQDYFSKTSFRAIFEANGNFVFDSVCKLEFQEGERNVKVWIQDVERMRDRDCNRITVFSEDNDIIFRIYYKPSEFIQEYGGASIHISLFNN